VITHVATTAADTRDVELVPEIHAALAQLDLLPSDHWVDAGYTSGANVADSAQVYGVRLIGPLPEDASWQARTPGGFSIDQFQIDRRKRQATCPQGQTSAHWSQIRDPQGLPEVQIAFPKGVCHACVVREHCTTSATAGRTLKLGAHHEVIQAGRQYEQTAAFWHEYTLRAGIEGTVSALVRQHGARRTRYRGSRKAHVQNLLIAMAANLRRAALWLMGQHPKTTRPPSLQCLAPA
jgi:transposase